MDPTRFDALTRQFIVSHSRRRLLSGALSIVAGLLSAGEGQAKRHRTAKRAQRQVKAGKTKCRGPGHSCEGRQANSCCAGLACVASARGSARRCTPCAAEGASCAGDEACCGGGCCRDALIDPVGTCCASQDRCCGRDCCTAGEACDFRFLMCVPCTPEGECQNPVPFCVCCPGLGIVCDETGCRCVPKPGTA